MSDYADKIIMGSIQEVWHVDDVLGNLVVVLSPVSAITYNSLELAGRRGINLLGALLYPLTKLNKKLMNV